ncbi:MAG TPA: MBL fold metallo-hydrolase [Gemmatimonadaceae bacterium]|nr:MBL fold metallo-hydrolase [Gemmatimonadaceae bacterium]
MTRNAARLLIPIVATASGAKILHAQGDPSQVPVKVTRVSGGVYMLEGAGGNIGLSVGSDDAFMVDDQLAPLTAKIKAAIATVTPRPVRFLLNTHWHPDHTGGNENMAGGGAIILAHENVRRRLSTEQFIAALDAKIPASPRGALPVLTFPDSITLFLNDDSVRAVHVRRAHTDGDVLVYFQKANVVHMGDTFFNGGYPLVDLSSGGSIRGTIAAVDRALATTNAQTRFIPGHGPLGNRAELVTYRNVLKTIADRVARMVAQNRSLKEVLAAKPSAEYDASWGKAFVNPDQFVTAVYSSLTASGRKPGR